MYIAFGTERPACCFVVADKEMSSCCGRRAVVKSCAQQRTAHCRLQQSMPLLEEVDPDAGDSAEGAEALKAAHRRRRSSKKKKRADVRTYWYCCCLDIFALGVGTFESPRPKPFVVSCVSTAVCLAWCVGELRSHHRWLLATAAAAAAGVCRTQVASLPFWNWLEVYSSAVDTFLVCVSRPTAVPPANSPAAVEPNSSSPCRRYCTLPAGSSCYGCSRL